MNKPRFLVMLEGVAAKSLNKDHAKLRINFMVAWAKARISLEFAACNIWHLSGQPINDAWRAVIDPIGGHWQNRANDNADSFRVGPAA